MNERTIDINTHCKKCVFATWALGIDSHSQIGCKFNRLDIFKQNGNKVEEVFDDVYYYKINTFCNYCRDKDWSKGKENMEEAIKKETELCIGYVLLVKDAGKELHSSLSELLNQKVKPKRIAVVFFNGNNKIKSFVEKIKEIEDVKIDVVNVLDWSDKENLIDHGAKRLSETHYITCLEEGFSLPQNFSLNLNKLINEDLKKISLIDTDGYNGLTIQTNTYKLLGGSFQEPIRDKIKNLAKIQGLSNMIMNYNEVV